MAYLCLVYGMRTVMEREPSSYTTSADLVNELLHRYANTRMYTLLTPIGWWAASAEDSGIHPLLRSVCEHVYLDGMRDQTTP